jgi:argininosuccinate lyase
MKLWSGRISGSMDPIVAQLNNSLPFDKRLAQVDITASIAWARALTKVSILNPEESDLIIEGLKTIQSEFAENRFVYIESDEDIHTAVERRLTELVGPAAGKLHTGRSRNDQVATDFRLWLLLTITTLQESLIKLQAALAERAEKDFSIVLPGYTHFQQAQPILISHWWLSHFWPLQRDRDRLKEIAERIAICPLGSGALAGTTLPIDREQLAQDLGFSRASFNSLDAVSDRDFAVEFLFWATLVGIHLSRLAEALILYSTKEYGFISLPDEYSTGSSLMPQKKNPDPLELARAKSGVLIGKLTGLLSTLKALPSAYDKDLQEDKLPVFEAADTLGLILPVIAGMISNLTVHKARCESAMSWQLLATDLADYLVAKGVPFREAHTAVGKIVRLAEERSMELPQLSLDQFQAIHPMFDQDLFGVFEIEHSLSLRAAAGGTAPKAVREQLEKARKLLNQ